MNIEFRSRIGETIDYNQLLNYGLCCKGITSVGYTGEFNYYSCFATGGVYVSYGLANIISGGAIIIPLNIKCPNPFLP